MKKVSVTQLKNELSAKLKGVRAGDPLLVTDRRKPFALISPIPGHMSEERLATMVAEGLVTPPSRPFDVAGFLARPLGASAHSLTAAVDQDREGR